VEGAAVEGALWKGRCGRGGVEVSIEEAAWKGQWWGRLVDVAAHLAEHALDPARSAVEWGLAEHVGREVERLDRRVEGDELAEYAAREGAELAVREV